MSISAHPQAVSAALTRCELAFRALGDACSAACDVVLASRSPALAGQLMDCWYVAGATARLLSRHADHPAKTIAMMVAVARQVTRAATGAVPLDPPPAVHAWVRATRDAQLAATAVLGLIGDESVEPTPAPAPRLRVTQEMEPEPRQALGVDAEPEPTAGRAR